MSQIKAIRPFITSTLLLGGVGLSSAALAAVQQVTGVPSPQTKNPAEAVAVTASYNVDDADNTLSGLGLNIHWDPTKLNFVNLTSVLATDKIAEGAGCTVDVGDLDGDPSTTCLVAVGWLSVSGIWPNVALPVDLATANFTSNVVAGDSTNVRFSASSTAAGYTFSGTPAQVNGPDATTTTTTTAAPTTTTTAVPTTTTTAAPTTTTTAAPTTTTTAAPTTTTTAAPTTTTTTGATTSTAPSTTSTTSDPGGGGSTTTATTPSTTQRPPAPIPAVGPAIIPLLAGLFGALGLFGLYRRRRSTARR